MTATQFYWALGRVPGRWRFGPHGEIRSARGCCPIVAVAKARRVPGWRLLRKEDGYGIAAQRLGLSRRLRDHIVDAADGRATAGYHRHRYALLAVTGLY